jgi:hypothetical protein
MKKIWKVSCKSDVSGIKQILKDLGYSNERISLFFKDENILYCINNSQYILFGIDSTDIFTDKDTGYGWDNYEHLDTLINTYGYIYCGQLYSRKDKLEKLKYESNM